MGKSNRREASAAMRRMAAIVLSFIICGVLVLGTAPFGYAAFAEEGSGPQSGPLSESSGSSDAKSEDISSSASESTSSTSEGSGQPAESAASSEAPESSATSDPARRSVAGTQQGLGVVASASSASVTLAGIDLAGITDASPFVTTGIQMENTLVLSMDIVLGPGNTGGQVMVAFNNALQPYSMPGFVLDAATRTWSFDAGTLTGQNQNIIANGSFAPGPDLWAGGPNAYAGTLTYTLKPNTTNANIALVVSSNYSYAVGDISGGTSAAFTYANPIEVAVAVAETPDVYEEFYRGSVDSIVSNPNNACFKIYSNRRGFFMRGESANLSMSPFVQNAKRLEDATANIPVEHLEFTFKMPKPLGVTAVVLDPAAASAPDALTYTIDCASDTEYDLVHVVWNGFIGNPTKYQIIVKFTVENDAEYKTYTAATLVGGAITLADGRTAAIDSAFDTLGNGLSVTVLENSGSNVLEVTGGSLPVGYEPAFYQTTNFLGKFNLSNKTASTVRDLAYQFDFTGEAGRIGVEAVSLPFNNPQDIVAETNKGNTYTAASLSNNYISKANLGIVDPDEYITQLTFTSPQSFLSGYVTSADIHYYTNAPAVYGKILLESPLGQSFSSTLTVVDKNLAFTSPAARSATSTITVKLPQHASFMTTCTNIDGSRTGGNTYGASVLVEPFGYLYTNNSVEKTDGIYFYLREAGVLTIDPASFVVVDQNGSHAVPQTNIYDGVDNTGHRYYRISAPDSIVGWAQDGTTSPYTVKLEYRYKVNASAPHTVIPQNALVTVKAMNQDMYCAAGREVKNTFNVTGSGSLTQSLASPYNTAPPMVVEPNQALGMQTAMNLNGGPYTTYDYATGLGQLSLNPAGAVRYQVKVSNNCGQPLSGFTVLIPIPKEGEDTGEMPADPADFDPDIHLQKEPFTWSMTLPEAVQLPVGYQVSYAENYATDKDSAAFQSWDAVDPDEVRMVRIVASFEMADGYAISFDFALGFLSNQLSDTYSGRVNTYSSFVYAEIPGATRYIPSEPVSLKCMIGIVKGVVYNDTDRNGVMDGAETGRNGVIVRAFAVADDTPMGMAVTKHGTLSDGSTESDGVFELLGVDPSTPVYLVFDNPASDDSLRYVTTAAVTPASNHLYATTDGITPSTTEAYNVRAGLMSYYKVTLAPNGGTVVLNPIHTFKLDAAPAASRTGYTFLGWYTQASGGSKYETFPLALSKDITMQAQWQANTYQVIFRANGGTGAMMPMDINYNQAKSLTANAFTRSGYSFLGWSTDADATVATYANSVNYIHATAGDMVLYAVWKEVTLSGGYVFRDLNNNGFFDGTDSKFGLDDISVKLYAVDSGGTVGSVVATTTTAADGSYGFSCVPNGIYVMKADVSAPYGYAMQAVGANASHVDTTTGYSAQVVVANAASQSTGINIGVRAKVKLSVEFKVGSILLETKDYEAYTDLTTAVSIEPGVTAGFAIPAHYHKATAQPAVLSHSYTWDSLLQTLVYNLEGNTYTVTFAGNGATTAVQPGSFLVTYPANTLAALPQAPSQVGYIFTGWEDSSNVAFDTSTVITQDITVYAQWKVAFYTLRFHANGGGNAPAAQQLKMGDLANAPIGMPTRQGYVFAGWNRKADGRGSEWDFDADAMPAYDVVLYAKWDALPSTSVVPAAPAEPASSSSVSASRSAGSSSTSSTSASSSASVSSLERVTPGSNSAAPFSSTSMPVAVSSAAPAGILADENDRFKEQSGNIMADIVNGRVPFGGLGEKGAWSFVSLLFAVAGGVLSVAFFVMLLRRPSSGFTGEKRSTFAKAAIVVLGLLAVALFLGLNDFHQYMVFVNRFTLLVAIVVLAQILLAVAWKVRQRKNNIQVGDLPLHEADIEY